MIFLSYRESSNKLYWECGKEQKQKKEERKKDNNFQKGKRERDDSTHARRFSPCRKATVLSIFFALFYG